MKPCDVNLVLFKLYELYPVFGAYMCLISTNIACNVYEYEAAIMQNIVQCNFYLFLKWMQYICGLFSP